MNSIQHTNTIIRTLKNIKKRLFLQSYVHCVLRWGYLWFGTSALVVTANEIWPFASTVFIVLALLTIGFVAPMVWSLWKLRNPIEQAQAADQEADLKDRLTTAWQFLHLHRQSSLHLTQIKETAEHIQNLDLKKTFPIRGGSHAWVGALALLLFTLSPLVPTPLAEAFVPDSVRIRHQQQNNEIHNLIANLSQVENNEIEAIRLKLEKIQKQFENKELSERDLMLELDRLDKHVQNQAQAIDIGALEQQLAHLIPHLTMNKATAKIGQSMGAGDIEKAIRELEKLGGEVEKGKFDQETLSNLKTSFQAAVSKMPLQENYSMLTDLSEAIKALDEQDFEQFNKNCQSLCKKLGRLNTMKQLLSASKKLSNCRSSLGQCNGSTSGNQNNGIGSASTGNPLADSSRLEHVNRELEQVKGILGQGPMKTETEYTEGDEGSSALPKNDEQASIDYSAIAEEAMEDESIPLSHRLHVKRYFQTIKQKDTE